MAGSRSHARCDRAACAITAEMRGSRHAENDVPQPATAGVPKVPGCADSSAQTETRYARVGASTLCGPTPRTDALVGQRRRPDMVSTVEHRPADVVPQPLVVEYELANGLRELVALPPALESTGAVALSLWRGSTCGLDRVGSRTELVRGDVCDHRRLAGGVRSVA